MTEKSVVQKLLDKAYELQELKTKLYDAIETNRTALRSLVDSEVVSQEERQSILEIYPVQRRPRKKQKGDDVDDE